jgi:hypothetical protein
MPIDIRKTINEAETFFVENGPYGVVAEQAPEKAIPWVYQPERGKDRATKYPGKGDVFVPPVSKYCTVAWKFPTPSILLFFLFPIFLSLVALSLTKLLYIRFYHESFFLFFRY